MTTKMVANFCRSLSFPNQPSTSNSSTSKPPPKKNSHVRSTSLPCKSHPIIFQLKDHISDLKTWALRPNNRTSAWLCYGLSQLKTVHESLDHLLQLPQTRVSLRQRCRWIEMVLEDLLRFVDVYGIFHTLILTLKQEHLAAQMAIRSRDDSKAVLYAKALKKMGKDMVKLISTIRPIRKRSDPDPKNWFNQCGGDYEIDEIIRRVIKVTVLVSLAFFGGISSSFLVQISTWQGLRLSNKVRIEENIQELEETGRLWGLRKNKGDEEMKMLVNKMKEMEDSLCGIECGTHQLFRSLINSRVSMLNLLTQ